MKPLPKFDKRAALDEAAEAKDWTCSDCGLPTEDGQTQCSTCREYEADVENGLFDFEDIPYNDNDFPSSPYGEPYYSYPSHYYENYAPEPEPFFFDDDYLAEYY